MKLSNAQRRHLRGLSHHINPVVIVGEKGLTENVMAELENALDHHELIKVRLRTDRDTRKALIAEISSACNAVVVHSIGQVCCYFRRNPKKPVVELPGG